jgi:hypothetical protein
MSNNAAVTAPDADGRTGEIGRVSIGKIEKKGRQNRRVSLALDN